jgi:hypothetical protein
MKMITCRRLLGSFVLVPLLLSFFGGVTSPATEPDADEAAIRKLVDTYFSSWSNVDFVVYRSLFRQNATVVFIENDRCQLWDLAKFLDDQEKIQVQHRMEEVPLSVEIKARSSKAAFVDVSWQLKRTPDGPGMTGKDWFTLVKEGQDWKILNLTFWSDAPESLRAK